MTKPARFRLLAVAAVILMWTGPLDAQNRGRNGVWGSLGAGIGLGGFSCSSCVQGSSTGGFVAFLGLGTPVNRHIHLSVEADGWFKNKDGNQIRLMMIGGVIQWYPERRGFFLKGGLGFSSAQSDQFTTSGGTASVSQTGMGFILGLGLDKQLGDNVSLTGMINFYGGPVEDNNNVFWRANYTVLQALVGVTIHKGPPPKDPLPWE